MANEKNTIVGKGRMDYNKKQGNCKKAGIIYGKKSVICGMKNSRQQDRSGFGLPAHWKDFFSK